AEVKEVDADEVLSALPVAPDGFTVELVSGVARHGAEIDDVLRRFARDWALERMPAIDRTLLRIGVFELVHRPDVPAAVVQSQAMTGDDIRRALTRIAHEVVERNQGLDDIVIVGLQTGGVGLADRLAQALQRVESAEVPVGTLDVAFYRDDIGLRPVMPEAV